MAPLWNKSDVNVVDSPDDRESDSNMSLGGYIYISTSVVLLFLVFVVICIKCFAIGQKTRSQPQRRTYGRRGSVPQQEPTIFVSPGNYPPPPKYEHMAPPSYEEVVGIHYPNYPPSQFPITRPLAVALAQNNEMLNGTTSAAHVTASAANNVTQNAANNVISCTNNVAESTTSNVTVRTSNANEQTDNSNNNVPSVTVAAS